MSVIDPGLKRSMQKAAANEEKFKKKDEAQRAKQAEIDRKRALNAPQKEKATKKIIATQERKRAREKKEYEGEDLAGDSQMVYSIRKGKDITVNQALYDVHEFLKARPDYAEASLAEIRQGAGVDLQINTWLLETLREKRKVEVIDEPGQLPRLSYLPAYGVRDGASLLHLLQHAHPGAADGHTEAVRRIELTPEETFQDVDREIDRLVEEGRCTRVVRTDIPGKEGDRKKDVLYAPLAGERASDAMRELWHKVKVPKGKELQDTLVSRKVRTEDELQVRQQRKAAAHQKRQEARAKKKKRAATFRTVTNSHLAAEDPSLFGGQLRGQALAQQQAAQKAAAAGSSAQLMPPPSARR